MSNDVHPLIALCERAQCSPDFDVVNGYDEERAIGWLQARLAERGYLAGTEEVRKALRTWHQRAALREADRICPRSFAINPEDHVDLMADAPGWGVCRTCGETLNIQGGQIPSHRTSAAKLEEG